MTQHEENHYIEQVLQGNTQAFAYLVNKHKAKVFSLCFQITKSREDAEEVCQDVFLKVFQSLKSFRQDAKLATWLYKIGYHLSLNKIKRKKQGHISIQNDEQDAIRLPDLADTTFESSFETLKKEQQKIYIQKALEQLNTNDQVVLTLFYLNENSIDEIVEITEMTKSNVKTRLHRSRIKLYDALASLLNEEVKDLI